MILNQPLITKQCQLDLYMKKNKTIIYNAILICCILFISACAPTAQIPVMRPAEINFKGKQSMMIGEFGGSIGSLTSDLLASKLLANGYFQLVERKNIGRIMDEYDLSRMGILDEKTAMKIGKMSGAAVLVYGNSTAKFSVDLTKDRWKDDKGHHTTYKKHGLASVSSTFRVVDMTTGRVLAVKMLSNEAGEDTSETDQYPPDPDDDTLVREALNKVIDDFIKTVAPYREMVTVEFASNDSNRPEIEAGINSCKVGRWNDAIEQFRLATKKYPGDFSAWYNLGLAYEYTYMFQDAEDAIARANAIKPDDKCVKEISNIRQLAIERKKLESQQ